MYLLQGIGQGVDSHIDLSGCGIRFREQRQEIRSSAAVSLGLQGGNALTQLYQSLLTTLLHREHPAAKNPAIPQKASKSLFVCDTHHGFGLRVGSLLLP